MARLGRLRLGLVPWKCTDTQFAPIDQGHAGEHAVPCHTVPCCTMLCRAMPCRAVPCHATLPHRAVLRRASLPSLSVQLTTGSCTSIFGTFVLAGETPDRGALGEPLPAPARGRARLVPLPHPCCPGRGSLPRCRKLHGARSLSCSAETRTPARPHSTAMM